MKKKLLYLTAASLLAVSSNALTPVLAAGGSISAGSADSQAPQTCAQVKERLKDVPGVWAGVSEGSDSDTCSINGMVRTEVNGAFIWSGTDTNLSARGGYVIFEGRGAQGKAGKHVISNSNIIDTSKLPVAHNAEEIRALGAAMQEGDLAIMPITITVKANTPDGGEISDFKPITFTAPRVVTKLKDKFYYTYYAPSNKADSDDPNEMEYSTPLYPHIYWLNEAGKVGYQGKPNSSPATFDRDPKILKLYTLPNTYLAFGYGLLITGNLTFTGPATLDQLADLSAPKLSAVFHADNVAAQDLSELTLTTSNNEDKPLEFKKDEAADKLAANLTAVKALDGQPATLSSDASLPAGSYSITIAGDGVQTSVEDGKLKIEGIEEGKTYTATYTLMRARLDNPAVTFAYPLTKTVTFTVKKSAQPVRRPNTPGPDPVVPGDPGSEPSTSAPGTNTSTGNGNSAGNGNGAGNGAGNGTGNGSGNHQTAGNASGNKVIVKSKRHLASTGADASGLLLAAVFGVAGLALVELKRRRKQS